MQKTYWASHLLKPVQEELNKALLNPKAAARELAMGFFVQPLGIKTPELPYETYTDVDPGAWYLIDDKNIKIKEEEVSPTVRRYVGSLVEDAPKEVPEPDITEVHVDVNLEIKDGHILAEFGCVKHVCHNLSELMVVAKKELLKEMPILKDFGKAKLTKKGGKKDEKASQEM